MMAAGNICATVRTESADFFLTILLTANGSITHDNTLRVSMAIMRALSRIDVGDRAANPINERQQKMVGNGMTSPATSHLGKRLCGGSTKDVA